MKLYNTIIVFDVYTTANSEAEAHEAALALIRAQEEPLAPSEHTELESREPRNVRKKWENERPLVAASITDEEFETLKGKTTLEVQAMLYKKAEAPK